ncbi:MAG: SseB family protein [Lachnospiraceae bacterium]|nr:SseB family protein [Candidatus Colinaster scatohippi]
MTKESFLPQIPQMDGMYIVFSTATRCPYVVCNPETYDDETYVCLTDEVAEKKVGELRGNTIPVDFFKIKKEGMLNYFNELYGFGVNAVRFFTGDDEICLQLTEFVNKGDISKLPEERRPLENPSLILSMLYFCQEVRYKGRDLKKVAELEEEMVANISRSQFLVPVREISNKEDGKKDVKFMVVKSSNGEPVVPVFTDTVTLKHFLGKQVCHVIKMTIEQIGNLQIPGIEKGFLINPNGVGLLLNKEQINHIKETFK